MTACYDRPRPRAYVTWVIAIFSALLGVVAQSWATRLTEGRELGNIETRLAAVETIVNRITCLQVVGTVEACGSPRRSAVEGGGS